MLRLRVIAEIDFMVSSLDAEHDALADVKKEYNKGNSELAPYGYDPELLIVVSLDIS
jgi:hypothetical protein